MVYSSVFSYLRPLRNLRFNSDPVGLCTESVDNFCRPIVSRKVMKVFFCFAVLGLLLTGCASTSARREPKISVAQMQRFWVERRLADNHRIDAALTQELRALGKEADYGPLTMMPERGIQAVIVYEDRWEWNFGDHLTELRLTLRDPHTHKLLAVAVYSYPLGFGADPVNASRAVLAKLFAVKSP